MKCILSILFLTLFAIGPEPIQASSQINSPIVVTSLGQLVGTVEQSAKGREYYSFRGIPYASPPVGDLRFQPTQAAGPWTGILNATSDVQRCAQLGDNEPTEDCLNLYINSPALPSPEVNVSFPVLVFYHGGAFCQGDATTSSNGPQRFMDYDIIVVTVAYRLGAFGFLSTGDEILSGNFGLLDQVQSLKWIQDNIEPFGGDKNRVTIYGESAGAVAVINHVLSPASAGLFWAAIAESGSAVCGVNFQPDPLFWASTFSEQLKCPTLTTAAMLDCIKQKTTKEIVDASDAIQAYNSYYWPFQPVVENSETGRFMTELPITILKNQTYNRVPVLSGINKNEGDLFYSSLQQYFQVIDDNFFNNMLPQFVHMWTKINKNSLNVSYAIKAEYYDKINLTDNLEVARTSVDLNSDAFMIAANDVTVRLLANGGLDTFMYSFEYYGSGSSLNYTGEGDVNHGDEMYYLFNERTLNDKDQYVSDRLLEMWTNFATYQNPTPADSEIQWLPTKDTEELNYLQIRDGSFTMQTGYRTEQMRFWETIVPSIVAA